MTDPTNAPVIDVGPRDDGPCPLCGDRCTPRDIGLAYLDAARWCRTCSLDNPVGAVIVALDDIAAELRAASPEDRPQVLGIVLKTVDYLIVTSKDEGGIQP